MGVVHMPSTLLERSAESEALLGVLDRASAGGGAAAVVVGPAGIGKTALLNDVIDQNAANFTVLRATGTVLERDFGFGVVRQLVACLSADQQARAIDAAGPRGRAVLDSHAPPSPLSPDLVFATLSGLFWGIAEIADEGLLLVVDDAQWVDEESIRFLDFLLRRLADLPIAVLIGTRPLDVGHPAVALMDADGIELGPLSRSAIEELVQSRVGPDSSGTLVDACFAWTGGNPQYLNELMSTLVSEGLDWSTQVAARIDSIAPKAVDAVIQARLRRTGAPAVSFAQALAVVGDGAQLPVVARVAELDLENAAGAVATLVAADIVTQDLTFVHPLVHSSIYESIPPARRGVMHLAVAKLLVDMRHPIESVAVQLLAAPVGSGWGASALHEAADEAMQRGAIGAARAYLRRAAEEPLGDGERGSVLAQLGLAETLSGAPEALDHLAEASRLLRDDAGRRNEVDLARVRLLGYAGHSAAAVTLADECARRGNGSEPVVTFEAMALYFAGLAPNLWRPEPDRIARLGTAAGGTPAERTGLMVAACELLKSDSSDRANVSSVLDRILQLDLDQLVHGEVGGSGSPDVTNVITALHFLHGLGQAQRSFDIAASLVGQAQRTGSTMWQVEALGVRAYAGYRLGRLADAEADARAALEGSRQLFGTSSYIALTALIYTLIARGDVSGALHVAESFSVPEGREDGAITSMVDESVGRALAASGRLDEGLERLMRAGEQMTAVGVRCAEMSNWRISAATALIRAGRRADAADVLEPALVAARRSGVPLGLGRVLRVAALVENPVSIELLQESVAVLEHSDLRLKHAESLVELGSALRRMNLRRDAREPLAAGLRLAEVSGAVPLSARARRELVDAGGRPRTVERSGVASLTPSERRVARMAADGFTNREIAQTLFVQPKTVENHLSSVFRKLSIDSRAQIPDGEFTTQTE